MSQRGRPSLASAAAVNQVYAQASGFAPPGGMTSPPNVFSPRTTAGPTAATVQQPRTRSRAAAYYDYGDDDDFRYNETGATASSAGRWPTFSLGSVILCALFAFFLALGTNFRILTVGATDADARALASRVKSVSESIDAVAKALAADAKRRPASSGASASGRDVSALRSDLAKMQKQLKAQDDALKKVPKQLAAAAAPAAKAPPPGTVSVDAKELEQLRLQVASLTKAREDGASAAARAAGETEALRRELERARGAGEALASRVSALADREAERDADLKKKMDGWRGRPVVSMDHVSEEVRLQMQMLSADRTGLVDFALYSGGGKVVGHSQLSPLVARADGPLTAALKGMRGGVHPRADGWVLSGGSETPGECLALRGGDAWVDVRLREAVAVEAVTLEHIHRYIAYDITSAPKTVAVLGWNRTKTPSDGRAVDFGAVRYDLASDRGTMQTFNLTKNAGAVVDHVRFHVKSNYGNEEWTCLYRLRVHGTPARSPRAPVFD